MKNVSKKPGRGGARPGSGQPKKDLIKQGYKVKPDLDRWLGDQAKTEGKTKSALLNEILEEARGKRK